MMENVITVGTIGLAYENRKSGRKGVLVAKDDVNRVLTFNGDNGEFTVSYGAFKSTWRKCITDEPVPDPGPTHVDVPPTDEPKPVKEKKPRKKKEPEEEPEPEPYVPAEGLPLKDADSIIEKEGIIVAAIKGGVLFMLPDLWSFSNVAKLCNLSSMHFHQANFHIYVGIELNEGVTVDDVKSELAGAIAELNLYGYTMEDDE